MSTSNTSIVSDVTPWWWSHAWDSQSRDEVKTLLAKATQAIAVMRADLEEIRVCRGGIEIRVAVVNDDVDHAYAQAEALGAVLDDMGNDSGLKKQAARPN